MSETPELPTGEFDLIYADPPWQYNFSKTSNREIENHYQTMEISDIEWLEPPAASNCVLYLWATAPKLKEALSVMDSWGFEYKTNCVWDKQKIGMGYWARGQHELLLIGTRGDISPPDPQVRRSSIFQEEATKHSAKPDKVRSYLEEAHPEADKLEMFCRDGRVGWTVWGDEADNKPQDTLERYTNE